ncbi:MAG: hypothetical protein AB2L14_14665 [Candidatus Xenobiia bacterium LiM19]
MITVLDCPEILNLNDSIKKNEKVIRPGFRTLFRSGCTADVTANRGILDEGVNFLQKPFTVESLAQKIRETLDE